MKQQTHNVIIVSGHATGADELGERFAADHGLKCELYPAERDKFRRNISFKEG